MAVFTARYKLRLSEKAFKKLNADAAKNGMTRSGYVRHLIRAKPIIPFPKDDLSEFIRAANEVGQIVNKYAVKAHTHGYVYADEILSCWEKLQRSTDGFFSIFVTRSNEIWAEQKNCKLFSCNCKKKIAVEIRMTEQEKEAFDRQVKASGLTAGSYLTVLLEGKRNDENPTEEFFRFFREIDDIKFNVSSIVLFLHDTTCRAYTVCSDFLEWLEDFEGKCHYIMCERVEPERKYW